MLWISAPELPPTVVEFRPLSSPKPAKYRFRGWCKKWKAVDFYNIVFEGEMADKSERDFDKYAFGALRDGFEQLRLAELVPRIAVSALELPYLSSYDRKRKMKFTQTQNPGFDDFGSMDVVAKFVPSTVLDQMHLGLLSNCPVVLLLACCPIVLLAR